MIETYADSSALAVLPRPRKTSPSASPALRAKQQSGSARSVREPDPIAACVLAALTQRSVSQRVQERRTEQRYPYPHPIYLTPVADDGPRVDETIQVMGKHLSQHGLDFYHREPVPYRRMIASLALEGGWVGLVLDLKWCRFTSDGWYDNGGRFVAAIRSPLAAE
jgi:hypothetical protein